MIKYFKFALLSMLIGCGYKSQETTVFEGYSDNEAELKQVLKRSTTLPDGIHEISYSFLEGNKVKSKTVIIRVSENRPVHEKGTDGMLLNNRMAVVQSIVSNKSK